jgi:hypothetical protein
VLSDDDFWQEVAAAHGQLQELWKEAVEFLRKLPKLKHFVDQRDRVSRYLRYGRAWHPRPERRVGLVRNGRNSQIHEFYVAFRRFTQKVLSAFDNVAAVLPRHEVEALKIEIDPGKIESTCRAVERAAQRIEEFRWALDKGVDPLVAAPKPRKRGRPSKIPDERKQRALAAKGNKERAMILYGTTYPTPQQVKNVYSILKNYQKSHNF